jgi:hypothetical protein
MRKWMVIAGSLGLILAGIFIGKAVEQLQQAQARELFSVTRSELSAQPPAAAHDGDPIVIAQAAQKAQGKGDEWVVKIENTVVSIDEFQREFKVHVFSLPLDGEQKKKYENDVMNKKKFLANLINEYLIQKKALQEGYEKKKEVQDILKAVTRRAIIQVYLNDKLEPKLTEPTDEQIETIYNQNKKLFANADIEVARQQIKYQLLQRQYNDLLDELIDKIKGETRVVRNDEAKL